jgi:hypothetical protein
MNVIPIWQPRWHDSVVLIAKTKVRRDNVIVFTKAPTLPDRYRVLGEAIRSYPLTTNGRIVCYAVPLDVVRGGKINDNQLSLTEDL